MVSGLPFSSTSGIFGKTVPKLRIVSASAPLPLIFQNVGVHSSYVRGDVGIASYGITRRIPVERGGARTGNFAQSAAAAQKGRRYYNLRPLAWNLQTCGAHHNNLPMRGARLGSQETLVSCGVLWVLSFAGERKYLAEGHSPRGVGDAAPYGGWKGLPRSAAAGHMGPALQISIENRPLERRKGPAAVLRGLFFSIRGCLGIFSDRVDQSWKSGVER